jgi:DivIVA domain-containing protein
VTLFFILFTIALLGAVFALAGGRIAAGFDSPATSIPARALPEGSVGPEDVDSLRFVPALRGYRMDQVDAAMDRLRDELRRHDHELAVLRDGEDVAGDDPGENRTGDGLVDGDIEDGTTDPAPGETRP